MQALSSSAQSIETSKETFSMVAASIRPLLDIMQSNFGPSGTSKMLVSASGDIKLTKDGATLLNEMQIRNPVTSIIAKTVAMQSSSAGDGTTALLLLIAGLILESERHVVQESVHVSHLITGISLGMKFCESLMREMQINDMDLDRPLLIDVARSAVSTKVNKELADMISEQCVDAIHNILDRSTMKLNLHMIEVMHMTHKTARDTQLVRGIVMDHGGRHPLMPRELRNCYILTANVSLEYEKTEVNSSVNYSSASQREKFFRGEREFIDKRCHDIVSLKNEVCKNGEGFVVLTMGGIDTHSLDILAKNQILGLRRVKKRNLERLTLCCGGVSVNSTENLNIKHLGKAGHVKQFTLGEENFTIVDECQNPRSVTLLIKGPNQYTIDQMKDAIQDGLMSITNTLIEQSLLPGACTFELTASRRLFDYAKKLPDSYNVKVRLGVEVLARALEYLPKTLVRNAGFDAYETILKSQNLENGKNISKESFLGVNLKNGELFKAAENGVYDSLKSKIMMLYAASNVVETFMSIDAVIKSAPEGMRGK